MNNNSEGHTIGQDKVVGIHYTLTDKEGKQIDKSAEGKPLNYLHGHQNIIPGLERELEGLKAGDTKTVHVKAEEAYGNHNPELVSVADKSAFPEGHEIEVGDQFEANTEHGSMIFTVTKIEGSNVTVDANHTLAGQDLTFEIHVDSVREATDQEKQHGHVHSGGHDH